MKREVDGLAFRSQVVSDMFPRPVQTCPEPKEDFKR
jgi:hypothetical protein